MVLNTSKLIKYVLPLAVLVIAVGLAQIIKATKPEPQVRENAPSMLSVDATRLVPTRYPVVIRSQGTVQPTLANTLVPAVAGTVVQLNEAFVEGGRFQAGDVLLRIDPRDYEIALTQAHANFAQVDARLQEEQALAEQALAEWQSLGRRGTPSALTLRQPQLAAANANKDAASAEVQRARLDLERTQVIAPYEGIVSERSVDLGQFVARGAPVGRIHAINSVDVRLPLSNSQLTYLDLPDSSRLPGTPNVELSATIGSIEHIWTGELVRAEGIDAMTQQLNVIARIDNPFKQGARPLRVGQFVEAKIEGQVLENVFVVPRQALREEREVLVIDENQSIQRRTVNVAWSDTDVAAINDGLNEGDLLVLTPMSTVADGTPVRATIDGVAPTAVDS